MLNMDRIQQRFFIVMAMIILILAGILIYKEYSWGNNKAIALETQTETSPQSTRSGNVGSTDRTDGDGGVLIQIYVTGQVEKPGIITIMSHSRIADALELAGGALPDADLNRINLALKVKDEGMYYIPAKGEEIPQDIPLLPSDTGNGSDNNGTININTGDQKLLETLTGIGPSRSKLIIEYRDKNGGFKYIEEIMNVSGIGEKIFEGLKDQITVR